MSHFNSKRTKVPPEIAASAYRQLFQMFRSLSPISGELEEQIYAHTEPILFRPREVLHDYGKVCRYVYFCFRGLVKSTFVKDGLEKIVWFMGAGDTIIAVHSWFDQKPSEEKITAIKETLCIALSYDSLQALKRSYPEFVALNLAMVEKHLVQIIQRTKWIQYSTDEKIENLEEMYPRWLKEIPSGQLANYLGITRETFSRKMAGRR